MKTLRVALLSEEANVGSVLQPPYSVASGSPSAVSRWRASSTRGCSSGSASLPRGNEPLVSGSGDLNDPSPRRDGPAARGGPDGAKGSGTSSPFFQLSVLPILIASPEGIPVSAHVQKSCTRTRAEMNAGVTRFRLIVNSQIAT